MKYKFIFLILIILSHISFSQETNKKDLSVGDEYFFASENLNRKLKVFIGLPKDYHKSNCTYPVHYVLDGQIIFPFFYGTADILSRGDIPESIVVGIQSVNRGYYFKPGDGANEFIDFLSEELIPFINKNYRTNEFRSICGHSTTGAFILNSILYHPNLFDMYFAGAPYHSRMLLEKDPATLISNYDKNKYLYVFYGLEDNDKEKADWDSLRVIIEKMKNEKLSLVNKEYENEDHYSVIYRYIPDGLKEAFKGWKYQPDQGEEFTLSGLEKYRETQKGRFNVSFNYGDRYFIDEAMSMLRKGEKEKIIALMKYGLSYHPNSVILHNIIAVEYENTGKLDLAKIHYRRMLEIDPDLPPEISSKIPKLD
ncbi:alpha/beta hydrolase-fold protein [Bacteroidota bacterium]